MSSPRITIVGCGVVGLTTALAALEAGRGARIVASDLPPMTTSNRAAAIWLPYRADPMDLIRGWCATTYDRYVHEAQDHASGVSLVPLRELLWSAPEAPFWLQPNMPYRRLDPSEVGADHVWGYEAEVPFIHSDRYLAWLMERFLGAGGVIEQRALRSLEDAREGDEVVVHCAGLGARSLAGDGDVHAIRGQLAVVRSHADIGWRVGDLSAEEPVYVLSRGDGEVVLGGTAEVGDEDLRENAATREQILARCVRLVPELAGAEFLRGVVGLRPGRSRIRLEREMGAAGRVTVHNYGHGGSGFTVAWGCAREAVRLATV